MNNIFLQYSLNGDVNSYGKAYIGKQGQSPIDEANALTVYTDVNKINSLSGFAIDLDFDGLPVVDGSRVELYTDEAYTLQLADKRGAYLFIDWLSVNASIGTTETKNWVKTLEPETTNLTVNNDGEGNYTINAASLGGGDVFKGSSNTYDQGTTQAFDDITATAAIVGGKNLDVSSSESNTYAPGTTQAFDAATANTMSVGGVDVAAKNTEQDSEISANSSFNNGFKSDSSYGVGTSAPKVVSISNISGSKKYEVNFKGGFTSGGATGCNFKVDIETSPGLGSVDIIYILDFTRNGQAITFGGPSSLNPNESNTLINQPILFNSSDDIGGLSFCMSLNTPTEAKAIESISISYIDSGGTIGVPTLFISSQPAKP